MSEKLDPYFADFKPRIAVLEKPNMIQAISNGDWIYVLLAHEAYFLARAHRVSNGGQKGYILYYTGNWQDELPVELCEQASGGSSINLADPDYPDWAYSATEVSSALRPGLIISRTMRTHIRELPPFPDGTAIYGHVSPQEFWIIEAVRVASGPNGAVYPVAMTRALTDGTVQTQALTGFTLVRTDESDLELVNQI